MDTQKLNALPEVANRFMAELREGEKVIYTSEVEQFGDQAGMRMHSVAVTPFLTITNQRIIIDIRTGYWEFDIESQVAEVKKKVSGKNFLFLRQITYFIITLREPFRYTDTMGKKLKGFELYFKDEDITGFDAFINQAFV